MRKNSQESHIQCTYFFFQSVVLFKAASWLLSETENNTHVFFLVYVENIVIVLIYREYYVPMLCKSGNGRGYFFSLDSGKHSKEKAWFINSLLNIIIKLFLGVQTSNIKCYGVLPAHGYSPAVRGGFPRRGQARLLFVIYTWAWWMCEVRQELECAHTCCRGRRVSNISFSFFFLCYYCCWPGISRRRSTLVINQVNWWAS